MPNLKLDDFQLGPTLGVGTVGTIYASVDKDSGEAVAVKVLHPAVCSDPLIRARFKREMTILSRLRHPNIIRYFGGGQRDGQLFYVMELVEGGSVKDLLQNSGPLAWPAVVSCVGQLCSALQCAHNHGVIHRDLKPANLFLTADGQVKLGDFGIARDVTSADLTGHGLTVGTHAYMAPEQIVGDTSITGKADLYALGCCTYEMLSGQKPFQGENFAQLFEQHLRAAPPRVREIVTDCPPELDEVISQMLAKDPQQRPFNARQIQGVMYAIADRYQLEHARVGGDTSSRDVAAEQAIDLGRQQLAQRVRGHIGTLQPREASWGMFAVVGAILAAVVAVAVMLGA